MMAMSFRAQLGRPLRLRAKSLRIDFTWTVIIKARRAATIISTALSYGASISTATIAITEMNMHTHPSFHFAPTAKAIKAKMRSVQMVWIALTEPNTAPKADVTGWNAIKKNRTKINIYGYLQNYFIYSERTKRNTGTTHRKSMITNYTIFT